MRLGGYLPSSASLKETKRFRGWQCFRNQVKLDKLISWGHWNEISSTDYVVEFHLMTGEEPASEMPFLFHLQTK
jgi:hypothetical protein